MSHLSLTSTATFTMLLTHCIIKPYIYVVQAECGIHTIVYSYCVFIAIKITKDCVITGEFTNKPIKISINKLVGNRTLLT